MTSVMGAMRRNAELGLVLLAAVLTAGAYVLASLGRTSSIPANIGPFLGVILVLLVLGVPFLHVHFGFPDDRVLPRSASSHQVHQQLREDFAAGGAEAQVRRFLSDPRNPVPTVGGANLGQDRGAGLLAGPQDQAEVERRDDVLVYTTRPLKQNVEVVGPVQAVLYVATSAKDTATPRIRPATGMRRDISSSLAARNIEGAPAPSRV